MKRKIYFITLCLSMIFFNCHAQISRTIYGIPLLTSPNNAKQILANKGIIYSESKAEYGNTIIGRGDIFFANNKWEAIILVVKENKVYSIGFIMSGNMTDIGEKYMSIGNKLKEKYDQYASTPTTKETYSSIKININFDDNKTLVLTQCEINQFEESTITIGYADRVMYNKFQQDGINDL